MQTLYLDYSKCIGCGTCEAVCKFIYGHPRIIMTRTADGWWVPLYCQHCENPKCMKVCSRGALSRDEKSGAVLLQPGRCGECDTKNCLLACPYVAMICTGTKEPVTKCDLCVNRNNLGPACAPMCPCDALMVVERDELEDIQSPDAKKAFDRVRRHIICPECPTPR